MRLRQMTEKAKALWYEWIPSWLPIMLALLWIAMQYQKIEDRLDQQETQIKAIQEYMRTNLKQVLIDPPAAGLQPQAPPQEATRW
jgi:hypothetical protein